MKFLIAGLGNFGEEYLHTRHNIGFLIADALCGSCDGVFTQERHAWVSEIRVRGRKAVLIKPTTYMNLSGKALNYWLQEARIPRTRLLVLTDDIALPFGAIRIRTRGNDGGHNGLASVIEALGTAAFARLRFGIGDAFQKGRQVNYVLSRWTEAEEKQLPGRIDLCVEAVKCFIHAGPAEAMNRYNNK